MKSKRTRSTISLAIVISSVLTVQQVAGFGCGAKVVSCLVGQN